MGTADSGEFPDKGHGRPSDPDRVKLARVLESQPKDAESEPDVMDGAGGDGQPVLGRPGFLIDLNLTADGTDVASRIGTANER